MECQKTFNAPNKNLDKTDSGASLSVRLKFKEKKKLHLTMKVYIEKTRDQERIVYTQMRATLHACSQNKAKPLASIYIAFYLNMVYC